MATNQPLSLDVRQQIFTMGQQSPRLSSRQIGKVLNIHGNTVERWRNVKPEVQTTPTIQVEASALQAAISKHLKRSSASASELADALDVSPKRISSTIADMIARGAMITTDFDGRFDIKPHFAAEAGTAEVKSTTDHGDWSHVFGFITDNHLCNKHSRLDVLNEAYRTFERMGISIVYNAGNWVDGEARFNKTELITRPGMDSQLDYMIDKYPQVKGIATHYIAGDDHEGWYQQREGVEIGRYLQYRAQDQGRHDLNYLGYGEADVKLTNGSGSAVMRVVHPGGGTGYAVSYTDQKRVESYQGGEKPQVELVGHYHKYNVGYPREVHTVQGGCTCDQTMFMRKKKLQAHVGFSIIKIAQNSDGAINRFSTEFFPFFDRGYYRNDF